VNWLLASAAIHDVIGEIKRTGTMRIHIVEEGPSRYPILGDCPCGNGYIRTVSNNGHLLNFECGQKTDQPPACRKRFHHRGGEDGHILCATDEDPTLHDFGQMIEEKGKRYFESHLRGRDIL